MPSPAHLVAGGNREPVLAIPGQGLGYASRMEWTPARIRMLRETGLCLSQTAFAKALGFAMRTVGNAERGTHPPSLALRRALDQALDNATAAQRNRFLTAVAVDRGAVRPVLASRDREPASSPDSAVNADRSQANAVLGPPIRTLDALRSAVFSSSPAIPVDESRVTTQPAASVMAAAVQVYRLYQSADYDAAAELLPAILDRMSAGTEADLYTTLVGTLTARHATAVAYIVAAKLATKLGDVGLASMTADRAMTAANESEHLALTGAATYQVACALLGTGELADAERILTLGAAKLPALSRRRG